MKRFGKPFKSVELLNLGVKVLEDMEDLQVRKLRFVILKWVLFLYMTLLDFHSQNEEKCYILEDFDYFTINFVLESHTVETIV